MRCQLTPQETMPQVYHISVITAHAIKGSCNVSKSGTVPNRFGTELSEPKVSECQELKFFIKRTITTVNFPNTNTTEPKRKTNRSALFRCGVFQTVQSLEFQSSNPPLECPYSMSLARPGFRRIHKLLSVPFPCFPFQYAS